ncbi:MAG: TetR family transcriptional regulator [Actinobacteria bacterium]|uniref:Unannotated protein n=1 Tax=freshwater metagenome TaxID=449393 RepID=A0A6J5YG18_9ZZZZ|nr:TetR family transcriptional regulator [Actinomycetota bacterium]
MPKIVDHEERRSLLVAALWRIVQRDGASGITIRNVAAEAGIPKSTMEHYFADRLSLLSAAVSQVNANALSRLSKIDLTDGSLESGVDAVMIAIPDSPSRRRESEVWALLINERRVDTGAGTAAAALDESVRNTASVALNLWVTSGLVHPSRDLDIEASRLHALIDGLSLHVLHDPKAYPKARLRAIVTSHLADLVNAPAQHSLKS